MFKLSLVKEAKPIKHSQYKELYKERNKLNEHETEDEYWKNLASNCSRDTSSAVYAIDNEWSCFLPGSKWVLSCLTVEDSMIQSVR